MKTSKIAVLLALAIAPLLRAAAQDKPQDRPQDRPNIILFLVDDMGWQDTSVPFWDQVTALNKKFHTPNMERLCREGMKFTNAYATPLCTPSRTSLMTGMNAAHHKVSNYIEVEKDRDADVPDSLFAPVPWNSNGFDPTGKNIPRTVSATPLPQLLKDAGYFTIHVGKAHWGAIGVPGANPHNLGFVVNIAGHSAGHPQDYLGEHNYGNMPGKTTYYAVPDLEEYYGTHTFLSEALTREAIKAIDEPIRNGQPFFLYLAHYNVHQPITADDRYYHKYLEMGVDTLEAKYASMVEGMDQSLGEIMDFLKEKKLDKNTIIIFMSDNGGLSVRGKVHHIQNLPLTAGKGSVYEGGIREPMIVKWPGVVRPGSIAAQYLIIEDFFPSILEMAGVKNYKTIQKVDGKSFLPILKDPDLTDTLRTLVWHYPNKWLLQDGPGINYASAIRQGRWKLVYLMRRQKLELYDIAADIGEHHDLAAIYPDKVKSLAHLLTESFKKWHAQLPAYRSTGKPVAWPDEITQ